MSLPSVTSNDEPRMRARGGRSVGGETGACFFHVGEC